MLTDLCEADNRADGGPTLALLAPRSTDMDSRRPVRCQQHTASASPRIELAVLGREHSRARWRLTVGVGAQVPGRK